MLIWKTVRVLEVSIIYILIRTLQLVVHVLPRSNPATKNSNPDFKNTNPTTKNSKPNHKNTNEKKIENKHK